jgi:hypothetical protein
MMKTSAIAAVVALGFMAGCASAPPTSTAPVVSHQDVSTPPPILTTPVPIVHAKNITGAGRSDPFVAVFGPPETGSGSSGKVAVSTFPNIPTLPGFSNAPGQNDLWSTVKLTGVIQHGSSGYVAILEAEGKSYFVRPGDRVGDKFRVLSVGPDYITLATDKEERHFSLGG